MRILGKKKVEKHNNKVGGEMGSRGRRVHISHWWRNELSSTETEDENTSREQGRSL